MTEQERNTIEALLGLVEWATGNRGRKDGNPYLVPEVKNALRELTRLSGILPDRDNYLEGAKYARTMMDRCATWNEPLPPYRGLVVTGVVRERR